MRKIEERMVCAVRNMKNFREDNTEVKKYKNVTAVYLHGNLIFERFDDGSRFFTLAGWNTPTTRSRLNALGVKVCQRNFSPIYEGKEIDSNKWYEVL